MLYSQVMQTTKQHDRTDTRAVTTFAATGAISVLLVATITGLWVRDTSRKEAVRDARVATTAAARMWVSPALAGVTSTDPEAVRTVLDRGAPDIPTGDRLIRRKLWAADGTIVWSDEPRLEGQKYSIGAEELAVLRGNGTEADISDATAPENRFERGHGEILEVYTSVTAGDGTQYLYEEYLRQQDVQASGQQILVHFLPGMLAAMLLLWAVQIPLARSMVRRLDERRREGEQLLRQAVASSDLERMRIARDLHDGVVQQIAGTSIALHAQAATVTDEPTSELLKRASSDLRNALSGLRSLVVEIYPPNLAELGLAQAIDDLLDALRGQKIAARLSARVDAQPTADEAALAFRVAQEAIRNIEKHARARDVIVTLACTPDRLMMQIEDDGCGFDTSAPAPDGHLGVQLISDLVAAAGGTLKIESQAGAGTTVTLNLERNA